MGSRKKKNRRDRKKKRSQARKPGFSRQGLPDDFKIVPAVGGEKMSEVLLEFIEPYSDKWKNEEELSKLLALAIVAWNAATFSGSERDAFIEEMAQALPADARPFMRAIVMEMLQRKLLHFASNKRLILSFEVTPTPTGPYVAVVSSPGTE
jgi:hypothetical protein